MLLEGIEKCGLGNWKIIAEYMSGVKSVTSSGKSDTVTKDLKDKDNSCSVVNVIIRSAKEIESHYWDLYIGSAAGTRAAVGAGAGEDTRAAPSGTYPLCCSCYLPDRVYVTRRSHATVGTGGGSTHTETAHTRDLVPPHPSNDSSFGGITPCRQCSALHANHPLCAAALPATNGSAGAGGKAVGVSDARDLMRENLLPGEYCTVY